MSYDLTMFRVPDGVEPAQAYSELMEREEADVVAGVSQRSVGADRWADMRRLADVLKEWHPSFVEFVPETPLPSIELTDEELLVQFTVAENSVQINIPYFRDWPEAMFQCVTGGVAIVREITGYIAFDPQVGRMVTPHDLDDLVKQYRKVDKTSLLDAVPAQRELTSRRPWWKFWQ